MIERRRIPVLALLALMLAVSHASATGKAWVIRDTPDFADAQFQETTMTPEGRVTLSPSVSVLGELPQPFLWCLAVDPQGRVHAGGGNEGQVYRLGESGPELAFDAPELEVQAIAFDRKGRLYAGSSPEGRVYRVEEGAPGEIFFEPEARYIWAMAFDRSGSLLVATGQPGRIYRVDAEGKGEVLFEGRDDHIRTLVRDGEGGFLAGTDGSGVVYRIPRKGDPEVLYDSPSREIASIAILNGEVYAAGLRPITPRGKAAGTPSNAASRVQTSAEGSSESEGGDSEGNGQESRQRARSRPQQRFEGVIYRIDGSGFGRVIWISKDELPLSLLSGPSDRILVGLSTGGRIAALTPDGEMSDLARLAGAQVTALVPSAGPGIYAATSNLGAVFAVDSGYAREGTLTGGVRDAGFASRWGALDWEAETPGGTEIVFQVRTGDAGNPDATWSDWSEPMVNPAGVAIDRPAARFLQWRATFRSQGDESPILRSVRIHYLPENIPPIFQKVVVLDPGVYLQPSGPAPAPQAGPAASSRPRNPAPAAKQSFRRGMRSLRWEATDPNEDPLRATVEFRPEAGGDWRTLREKVEGNSVAWDSTAMPDGVYRVRILLSDEAANAPGRGRTASRVSAPFDVDNSPPEVSGVEMTLGSGKANVTAMVLDSFSVIREAAYSVDAADWIVLLPVDGVADSSEESFRFTTAELASGEHSIVIRARDGAGNASTETVKVTVP